MQTRRGLRDITNKAEESTGANEGKGGKKPGARVASASVGSADSGVAAPPAPVASSEATAAASSTAPVASSTAPKSTVAPSGSIRPIKTATRVATDIDLRDADEPLAVTEYVEDLYVFLREREVATKVDRRYMDSQPNVNERMRSILIDWLVEVHLKFKLVPDTLYLTVYLIDKYLELEKVSRCIVAFSRAPVSLQILWSLGICLDFCCCLAVRSRTRAFPRVIPRSMMCVVRLPAHLPSGRRSLSTTRHQLAPFSLGPNPLSMIQRNLPWVLLASRLTQGRIDRARLFEKRLVVESKQLMARDALLAYPGPFVCSVLQLSIS